MLDLNDVCVTFYPNTSNERIALDHLSFHIDDGDFISVLGTNGAGKSTLLNAISGTLECDAGEIILDGQDITYAPEYKRARVIGRLFQDPMKGTAPHMTIEENLGLAYSRGKRTTLSKAIKKGDRKFFLEQLASLGLGLEERITTNVGLLSGGQRQALTLLMATIVTPKLLLLDEHTAALDPKTAKQVMDITERMVKEHHITMLMITHNMKQALEYGNKTIILNEGKIVKVLEGEERRQTSVDDLLNMYDFV